MTQQPPPYPGELGPEPQAQLGQQGSPVDQPQSARGLGIAAISIAVVYAVFECIEAALSWSAQSRLMDAADAGERLDFVTPYDAVAVMWLPLLLVAYVLTCLWMYRSRKNVEILRPHAPQARRKGWVWAGWLVPFVSLVFPFQIIRDILINPRHPGKGTNLVGWWWGTFLLGTLVERIGLSGISGTSSSSSLSSLGPVETANALLMLISLVLWITIIRTISRDQNEEMSGSAAR